MYFVYRKVWESGSDVDHQPRPAPSHLTAQC
jgi:hypothetical protein